MSLAGKVAVVTGATQGIGRAITEVLVQEGVSMMLNARTASDLDAFKATLSQAYPSLSVATYAASVADAHAMESMINATLAQWGRLDIVINNAGVVLPLQLFQEISVADIHNTIDINLKGPMFVMKYAIPPMVEQGGGTIININSVAGQHAYAYSSVYCASKFGVTALSHCVEQEQRQNKIKIIGIYPGEVDTAMQTRMEPGVVKDSAQMLDPQTIAEAVRYVLTQPQKAMVRDLVVVPN